jgi:hypothetical protein
MKFLERAQQHEVSSAIYTPQTAHKLQPKDVDCFATLAIHHNQLLEQRTRLSEALIRMTKKYDASRLSTVCREQPYLYLTPDLPYHGPLRYSCLHSPLLTICRSTLAVSWLGQRVSSFHLSHLPHVHHHLPHHRLESLCSEPRILPSFLVRIRDALLPVLRYPVDYVMCSGPLCQL